MTHSDDDGLVLPPRMAPKQVVILPIYKNDEEKAKVLESCHALDKELKELQYHGYRVESFVDDRDLRGGEKKWYHVKRGVPVRVEIGPRDLENDSVFVGRRDQPKSAGTSRADFVATLIQTLDSIQDGLYERALAMRTEHTRTIKSWDKFQKFFKAKNENQPEIHGGFAECFFVDCPEVDEKLKPLKVTPRCIPLENNDEEGICIFTGQPTKTKGIFAKAY